MNRLGAACAFFLVIGCGCSPSPLLVYCSVDEAFAREILSKYQERTGRKLEVIFDSEAGKTTGLVRRIRAEAQSPRASVFWSSEVVNTLALADEGLLQSYNPPSAADIPDKYRDDQWRWTAVALRARVLAFDPRRTSPADIPHTWQELADEQFAGRLAFANPLFGTTRGHVAAMFALWGEPAGRQFLSGLAQRKAMMVDGNSAAVRMVLSGEVALAMTDSDDVLSANLHGETLSMSFPDMGDGGTLLMPCSVALIANAPRADEGKRLIDFLVSAEVEELLFKSPSGNYPVRPALRDRLGCKLPSASAMSYAAMGRALDSSTRAVQDILVR